MFLYRDWKCPKCGQVSKDVPTHILDQRCPSCGEKMEKVWAAPTTLFNGPGWTPIFHK